MKKFILLFMLCMSVDVFAQRENVMYYGDPSNSHYTIEVYAYLDGSQILTDIIYANRYTVENGSSIEINFLENGNQRTLVLIEFPVKIYNNNLNTSVRTKSRNKSKQYNNYNRHNSKNDSYNRSY